MLVVNVAGCALMGVLKVVIGELRSAPRLASPFPGTGVLGGFTTFSTYAVGTHLLLTGGRPVTGLPYGAATPLAALLAVWAGAGLPHGTR